MFYCRYGVNEALSILEDNLSSFSTADLFMLPPDSNLSDADSDDEDQPESLNHLSGRQLAVPTEVVLHNDQDGDGGDIEEQIEQTSRVQNKPKRKPVERDRKWSFADMESKEFHENQKPTYTEKSWTPVEVFQLFFDDELIEYIVQQSILYANQSGNHNFNTNCEEIRAVIGILLLSGYLSPPRRKMFWENSPDVRNAAVADAMPRNRFDECFRYLHFANNESLDSSDRYAKVRPLFTNLNEKFLLYFSHENCLSVDESMIPYYGRHGLKQHIHGKPIRFGYKVWCLCTSSGYLVQAEPYQEANTSVSITELGMGGLVVADLISELPQQNSYSLFFDNLFTSLLLLDYLKKKNVGGTGKIRHNRTKKAPLVEPGEMKKQPRGSFCQVTEEKNGITLVMWHDNSIVSLASNCIGAAPVHSTTR